jgi:hypothetical protein
MAAAMAARATPNTIIFDNQSDHPGGTLTFGTTSGPASLIDGVIDKVTSIDGVVTSFAVTGACGGGIYGCLSFTTGSLLSTTVAGDTTTYSYAAGGSLTITGAADGGSGVLFSDGGFAAPVTLNYNTVTGLSSLSGSLLSGTLDANLAASLGVSVFTPGGTGTNSAFDIIFNAENGSGAATTNSVQITGVPEPPSMLLLGAAFLAVASIRRRRFAEE